MTADDRSNVDVPILGLLNGLEDRLGGRLDEIRRTVSTSATKEDLRRLEKELAEQRREVERSRKDIDSLMAEEGARSAVGRHREKMSAFLWSCVGGAVSVGAIILGAYIGKGHP